MDFLQLKNKHILIFGVSNRRSVAFHIAKVLQEVDANLIFSIQNEAQRSIIDKHFPEAEVYICDATNDDDLNNIATSLRAKKIKLAGLVHSIAFANFSEGLKPFHQTVRKDFLQAVDISCFSFIKMGDIFKDIMAENSAMVTMSISTTRMASESYGYMAPIKAALDSSIVFLAKSLSNEHSIRVNGVGASLLKTSASAGIPGYIEPYLYAEKATLRKAALKTEEVANTVAFLLSPRSSGINAQTIVVDAGMSTNYFDKEIVSRVVQ